MEEQNKSDTEKNRTLKNSFLVLLALGLGSISQVITQIVIAYLYGSGRETDALFVAFVIPILLFWAIQNSSRVSLVPLLTDTLYQRGHAALWQYAGTLITVITLIAALFAAISSLSSSFIISIIAPGLDEYAASMASTIFTILCYTLVFAGILSLWISLQNIFSRFFIPALSDFFRASIVVAAAVVFYNTLGIYAIPVGFVAGTLIQCFVLVPGLRRAGYRYRFHLSVKDPQVRIFFSLTSLPFLSLLLRQGGTIVDRFLASFLPEGSISALTYSYTIGMGVILVVSGGLFSVSLPEFSRAAVRKRTAEIKDILTLNLKLAGIITFPLTVLIVLLSRPVIRLLYERGAFDASSTELTASLLSIYAVGIFFLTVVPVMLGVFYAFRDMYTPFIHLLLVFLINIVLSLTLMKPLGIRGLPLALSLAGIFSFIRMSMVLKKKDIWIFDRSLLTFWVKALASSLLMGIAILFFISWYSKGPEYMTMSGSLKALVISLLIGVTTFCFTAYLLRIEGRIYVINKIMRNILSSP